VKSEPSIRILHDTESDLEQVDRLLTTAYRPPSWRLEVETYLRVQPDGWFVADDDGEIVAMAGAVAYGAFCWLGLVATLPGHERRGLASRLSSRVVAWATEHRCRTVALDASEKGRPVYERLGFQRVGETLALVAPTSLPPDDRSPVELIADVAPLLGLDRSVFGGDRAGLLEAIHQVESPRIYAMRDGDELAGYLFARERLLGPGCARSPEVATHLVRAALADPSHRTDEEVRLLVPMEYEHTDALLSLGFRESRRLTHMRLGDQILPGKRRLLLAQASFAAG
jgi:GNAT superfamily N-acetyltransferase